MNTVKCTALVAFTHFVPGYGQVHGDPANSNPLAQAPEVPESAVQQLVDEGKISAPEAAPEATKSAPAPSPAKPAKTAAQADDAPAA